LPGNGKRQSLSGNKSFDKQERKWRFFISSQKDAVT
jgi:hypothetical protein